MATIIGAAKEYINVPSKDDVVEFVTEDMDKITEALLPGVMKNKIARKGKTILTNGLLTTLALLVAVTDLIALRHDGDYAGKAIVMILPCIFPLIFGACYFLHSIVFAWNKPKLVPSEAIEEEYMRTNSIPFVDSILELGISFRNGRTGIVAFNVLFFFALGGYCMYGAISELIYDEPDATAADQNVGKSFFIAVANAVFSLYQLAGDTNEYCVYIATATMSTKSNKSTKSNNDQEKEAQETSPLLK